MLKLNLFIVSGNVNILAFLIANGANLNILTNDGWSILSLAASKGIIMINLHKI